MGTRPRDAIDCDAGTVSIAASRVKTGRGRKTTRDDPKSDASARTIPVDKIQPGTIAALRALRASQAEERLAAGQGYSDSGLAMTDCLGGGIHPDACSNKLRVLSRTAGLSQIRCTPFVTHLHSSFTVLEWRRPTLHRSWAIRSEHIWPFTSPIRRRALSRQLHASANR